MLAARCKSSRREDGVGRWEVGGRMAGGGITASDRQARGMHLARGIRLREGGGRRRMRKEEGG
eukprot:2115676-Pyramimonas_sp.AAC.1